MEKVRHKSAWQRVSILTLTTTGRVRTIELTIWRVYLLIALVAVVIMVLLAALLWKVGRVSTQRDDLVRRNEELSRSLDNMRAAIEPLGEYEERIRSLIGVTVDRATEGSVGEPERIRVEAAQPVSPPGQQVVDSPIKVGMEEVKLSWRRPERGRLLLVFSFNLVNRSQNGGRASGSLLLVAKSTRQGSLSIGAFPREAVLDGDFPVDSKQGDPFSIRRLKPIRGTIEIPTGGEPFDQLLVYAFLYNGSLIYKASLPIEPPPA